MVRKRHIVTLLSALLCTLQAAPDGTGKVTHVYATYGLYEIRLENRVTQVGARHAVRRKGQLIGYLTVVRMRGGNSVCKLDKDNSPGVPRVGDDVGAAVIPKKPVHPTNPKPPADPTILPTAKTKPVVSPAPEPKSQLSPPELFALKIEPLLASRCYKCHGPAKQKGKLNLVQQSGAGDIRGILQVINPDNAADSDLLASLTDSDDPMPPKGPLLKPAEIGAIRRWIAAGAPPPPTVLAVPKASPGSAYSGTLHHFYPGGPRKTLTQLHNDRRNGVVIEWYPNGRKKAESQYIKGQLHGASAYWYKDGQLQYQATYQQGRLQGRASDWWPNGKPGSEEHYQAGRKHGLWKSWWPNGKLAEEKLWQNDVLVRTAKWNKDGNLRLPDLPQTDNDLALLTPKPAAFAKRVPWTISGNRNAIDKIYPGKPVNIIRAVFGIPHKSTPEAWIYNDLKITNPNTNRKFSRVRFEFKNGRVSRVTVFNN